MKYLASLLLFFIPFIQLQAQYFNDGSEDSQMDDPITWEASVEKENDSIFNLVFTATLEEGWHLYSQKEADIDIAPIATTFSYNNAEENFELIGETTEPDIEPIYDQVFEADITYFEDEAVFTQQIKVQPGSNPGIIAEIYFSVCDDEKCLPPETERFNISLEDNEITEGFTDLEISEKDKELTEALNINVSGMEKFAPEEEEGNNFLSIFY